jgi:hypothetical protein
MSVFNENLILFLTHLFSSPSSLCLSLYPSQVLLVSESTDSTDHTIIELQNQYKRKQLQLYLMIALLGITDLLLLYRLLSNGGKLF